jgi:uncharacterized heparinase superfamily protein
MLQISAACVGGSERVSGQARAHGADHGFRGALSRLFFANPLYTLTLRGRPPERLALTAQDPWPGDPAIADALFQGRFHFAGEDGQAVNQAPWDIPDRGEPWRAALHDFAWLRHFRAAGGDAARRHARALVVSWLAQHGRWDQLVWRPDVQGRRLIAWLSHGDFLLEGADETFRTAFLRALAEQSRQLSRAIGLAASGPAKLVAISALIHAGLCLPNARRRLAQGARLLDKTLAEQILADGGHVSRSPTQQLQVLRDLVALRSVLAQAKFEIPVALQNAIDRMAPLLRTFRHGDGRLALFHGGREGDEAEIDLVLSRADARGKPLSSAPHSRYERITARRAVLLIDVGAPPTAAYGAVAHAAPLSFELSIGRDRLVVNCGAPENPATAPAQALRATAAHSTLALADTNAVEIGADGHLNGRTCTVTAARNEANGCVWVDASHDGYAKRFGLLHRRRIYLDASGEDIRGEDSLSDTRGDRDSRNSLPFALRFHLHPDVHASLVQNGSTVLLKLASGAGYRLRAAGGTLKLEESIYLGSGQLRRTEQIVISGTTASVGETRIKWALSKVQPLAHEAKPASQKDEALD